MIYFPRCLDLTMQNAIFSVDDKQKAKGKGNILKFDLNKLNGNLAVFFNE